MGQAGWVQGAAVVVVVVVVVVAAPVMMAAAHVAVRDEGGTAFASTGAAEAASSGQSEGVCQSNGRAHHSVRVLRNLCRKSVCAEHDCQGEATEALHWFQVTLAKQAWPPVPTRKRAVRVGCHNAVSPASCDCPVESPDTAEK